MYLLVVEEELEVLKLSTSVRDLIGVAIESLTVLVLGACLIICEHANTIFHGEDLVIDAAIVAILIAQIVESLAQFSDQLVFLRRSNFHSACLSWPK